VNCVSAAGSRVILVDLDDTCVPDLDATRGAIAAVLEALELGHGAELLDEVLAFALAEWRAGPFLEHFLEVGVSSWEGLWLSAEHQGTMGDWVASYQRGVWAVAARLGDVEAREVRERYQQERRARSLPYPGVVEALESLRARFDLWLLTNGDSELQRRKLEIAGLEPYFDELFVSGDLGEAKPSPGFFAAVTDLLGSRGATVALSVGDSVEKDIAPALDRGWPAALVRSTDAGKPAPSGVPVVKSLGAVVELL
jgi:HAD superfamily hydrolase (TIGR01549 family)